SLGCDRDHSLRVRLSRRLFAVSPMGHTDQLVATASNAEAALVTREDVLPLETFHDSNCHAISFYYRPGEGNLAARDAMAVNLRARDIISNHFGAGKPCSGMLRDLDAVLHAVELASNHEAPLKVIFACYARGIWREFELPSSQRRVKLAAGT